MVHTCAVCIRERRGRRGSRRELNDVPTSETRGGEWRKTWREMRARHPLICIMERCIVIVSHSFYRQPRRSAAPSSSARLKSDVFLSLIAHDRVASSDFLGGPGDFEESTTKRSRYKNREASERNALEPYSFLPSGELALKYFFELVLSYVPGTMPPGPF